MATQDKTQWSATTVTIILVAIVLLGIIIYIVSQQGVTLLSADCKLCDTKNHEITISVQDAMVKEFNDNKTKYLPSPLNVQPMYIPFSYLQTAFSTASAIKFIFIAKDNKLGFVLQKMECKNGKLTDISSDLKIITTATDFASISLSEAQALEASYKNSTAYSNDPIVFEFFCSSFFTASQDIDGITGYNILLGVETTPSGKYKTAIIRPTTEGPGGRPVNRAFESAFPCPNYCN